MNNLEFKNSYSKYMLRNLLNMEETTFKTWMRAIEPELIKIEPGYGKYSKLLSYKAFMFLTNEYFGDQDEINKRLQDYSRGSSKNRGEPT